MIENQDLVADQELVVIPPGRLLVKSVVLTFFFSSGFGDGFGRSSSR